MKTPTIGKVKAIWPEVVPEKVIRKRSKKQKSSIDNQIDDFIKFIQGGKSCQQQVRT